MNSIYIIALLCVTIVTGKTSNSTTTANELAERYCYNNVTASVFCSPSGKINTNACRATYGNFSYTSCSVDRLSSFINVVLDYNLQYLLMASQYNTYKYNRPGFEKLYRGLSDSMWEDAQELIRYVTRRGGNVSFKVSNLERIEKGNQITDSTADLKLLARALDMMKNINKAANIIHKDLSTQKKCYDPDATSFLEKHIFGQYTKKLRDLTGHLSDMIGFLHHKNDDENRLSVFLFDEYLYSL